MINWNFPSNNYGQRSGLNDAGIETFKSAPLNFLAREIIQNSCDAGNNQIDKPVKVHFTLETINTCDFPDKENYINILNACKKFWGNDIKTLNFFNEALKKINKEKIRILKISDYNTVGLKNADQDRDGEWQVLVKTIGSTNKGPKSGGSYGIGKSAPFACSSLRTVFYGTKDINGIQAFQGVSKLVTHESPNGIETQGTGYYGENDKNSPILDFNKVNDFFKREEIGTDVFISGFYMDDDWESEIIKSVLENFFIAILDGKLIVHVGKNEINDQTLSNYLEKYIKNNKECLSYKYYESYTLSDIEIFHHNNFEGLGEIEFRVLLRNDMPKKVAMMRNNLMKIYDKGSFRTVSKFAGVLIVKAGKLDDFFRSIEPPTHNAWDPELHEDPNYAKKIIKELHKWMSDQINSISSKETVPEMLDIEGLNEYLPDDHENEKSYQFINSKDGENINSKDGEKSIPKKITITINNEKIKNLILDNSSNNNISHNNQISDQQGEQLNHKKSIVTFDTSSKNKEKNNNYKKRNTNNKFDAKNNKINFNNNETNKNLRIIKSRVFCIDSKQGLYKVILQTNEQGIVNLEFRIKGESDGDLVEIKSAILVNSREKLTLINSNRIVAVPFLKESKTELEIILKETDRYALEVIMYVD